VGFAFSILPAEADTLYLGGLSGSTTHSYYGFLGAIIPLPDNDLGKGWAVKLWGDGLGYRYGTGLGRTAASAWGGEVAAVYQFSGDWGWANLSAGVQLRNTRLSPDDPTNDARGTRASLKVQADGAYNLDDAWRLRGLASYATTASAYYVDGDIDARLMPGLRLGVELRNQGDRTFRQTAAGAIAFVQASDHLEIGASAGFSHDQGEDGLYAGLTFVLTR
jgi:hypothetical protein